ncbi:hypothetical protein, partial [Flavobacterium sp.]|uniref:hypothetical protein n=1 Tax=Flavobacterium sp. TaxID=239 RepID=UPI003342223C
MNYELKEYEIQDTKNKITDSRLKTEQSEVILELEANRPGFVCPKKTKLRVLELEANRPGFVCPKKTKLWLLELEANRPG